MRRGGRRHLRLDLRLNLRLRLRLRLDLRLEVGYGGSGRRERRDALDEGHQLALEEARLAGDVALDALGEGGGGDEVVEHVTQLPLQRPRVGGAALASRGRAPAASRVGNGVALLQQLPLVQQRAPEVDRSTIFRLHVRGVEPVVAVPELDEVGLGVAHGAVVMHGQVLERLHQAPLHVAGLRSLDSCVHQPFPPTHRVEEELRWREPRVEGVGDETLVRRCTRVAREVRQRAVDEAVGHPAAAHRLLPDARDHLRDVDKGALGAARRHRQRRVERMQLALADLARVVADLGEQPVDLRLDRLLRGAARRGRELARLELGDLEQARLVASVDELRLGRGKLGRGLHVLDADAEAVVGEEARGDLGEPLHGLRGGGGSRVAHEHREEAVL
mmetsp:Transcript_24647/g.57394  ORF Transcript_24647/g.57394 Transcript_24647/m.57394 type:complete len:389 (+) Transcript_24647:1017-2183(+)